MTQGCHAQLSDCEVQRQQTEQTRAARTQQRHQAPNLPTRKMKENAMMKGLDKYSMSKSTCSEENILFQTNLKLPSYPSNVETTDRNSQGSEIHSLQDLSNIPLGTSTHKKEKRNKNKMT